MDDFRVTSDNLQNIPERIEPLRRARRLKSASNPKYRFHDAILTITIFALWGYNILAESSKDSNQT